MEPSLYSALDESNRYPWEKDDAETPAAWGGFIAYRDCPKPRTLRRAAAWHYRGDADEQPSQGEHRQFKHWSYTYDWVSRVTAYDRHEDALKLQKKEEQIEAMATKQAQQAAASVEALLLPVRAILYKTRDMPIEETTLTDRDLAELLYLSRMSVRAAVPMMKMERIARGEPTDIVEGRFEHEHRAILLALSSREGREHLTRLGELVIEHGAEGGGDDLAGEPRALPPGGEIHPGEAHEGT